MAASNDEAGCGCIIMVVFGFIIWWAISAVGGEVKAERDKLTEWQLYMQERVKRLEERLDNKLDKRPSDNPTETGK